MQIQAQFLMLRLDTLPHAAGRRPTLLGAFQRWLTPRGSGSVSLPTPAQCSCASACGYMWRGCLPAAPGCATRRALFMWAGATRVAPDFDRAYFYLLTAQLSTTRSDHLRSSGSAMLVCGAGVGRRDATVAALRHVRAGGLRKWFSQVVGDSQLARFSENTSRCSTSRRS